MSKLHQRCSSLTVFRVEGRVCSPVARAAREHVFPPPAAPGGPPRRMRLSLCGCISTQGPASALPGPNSDFAWFFRFVFLLWALGQVT